MSRLIALICVFALVAASFSSQAADASGKKRVVFIAGKPSHGWGQHEHKAGCMLLAKYLNDNMPQIKADVYLNGWPADPKVLDGADAIIVYADGGGGHPAIPHLAEVDALAKKGVGIGMIHYAVEVPKEKGGKEFLDWIGGYFETNWSVNPHWRGEFTSIPNNPVTRGVKPFWSQDEWYYNMRFREGMKGVTPILTAVPPDSTRQGKDDAHGGNPFVRANKGRPETVLWLSENEGGGRGFGCTGGHFHRNWANDSFRTTVLNAIVWIAHVEVPENGVSSNRPSVDELLVNQDYAAPKNATETLTKELEKLNTAPAAK